MTNMTNQQADSLVKGLNRCLNKCTGRLAFAVMKNIRILQNELVEYYAKQDELLAEFGRREGDGYFIDSSCENFALFMKELAPFALMKIDVNLCKVTEDDLMNSELNGSEMMMMTVFTEGLE